MIPSSYFVFFAMGVFAMAAYGALTRKNILLVFFCVESMVMAASLIFIALAKTAESQIFVLFSWVISAGDTILALAIFLYMMKKSGSVEIDKLKNLKW